jgi:WD40 repeat protein
MGCYGVKGGWRTPHHSSCPGFTDRKVCGIFEAHTGSIGSVAFSSDSQRILSASDEKTISVRTVR